MRQGLPCCTPRVKQYTAPNSNLSSACVSSNGAGTSSIPDEVERLSADSLTGGLGLQGKGTEVYSVLEKSRLYVRFQKYDDSSSITTVGFVRIFESNVFAKPLLRCCNVLTSLPRI